MVNVGHSRRTTRLCMYNATKWHRLLRAALAGIHVARIQSRGNGSLWDMGPNILAVHICCHAAEHNMYQSRVEVLCTPACHQTRRDV